MSEIKAKLQEDIKTAMKAREQEKLTNLRGLMAAVKQVEVDERRELSDADIVSIIQKEVKKRRDTISFAKDRPEIVQQNEQEIALLQGYLGAQLSEAELRSLIEGLIASGQTNIGAIMGALNKDHKGKFEGKAASEIVKSLLG